MADYENIRLETSAGVVISYLPVTSTIELISVNDLTIYNKPYSEGGTVVADLHNWGRELVVQGTFHSTDAPMPDDFITALRAITGAPASWVAPNVITARQQFNFLNEKIISGDEFWFYNQGDYYKYAISSVDMAEGKYPPVTPKEIRTVGESSKDEISFTLRLVVGIVSLSRT